MGYNRILLQIYFGSGFLGSDMQAGNLPDCAEYFIVAYLQENCRMEGIMEFAEKNFRTSLCRR